MKIKEFIEDMEKSTVGIESEADFINMISKKLEVINYLPIDEKINLIDRVMNMSVYDYYGVLRVDTINCYIYFITYIVDKYTNLEFDDAYEFYDELNSHQLIPAIISMLGSEYDELNGLLSMRREEVDKNSSLDAQVSKLFDGILDAFNGMSSSVSNVVKGLNIDQDMIAKMVDSMMSKTEEV